MSHITHRRLWLKRINALLLLLIAVMGLFTWYANYTVSNCALGKTFNNATDLPHVKTGLLLGTSKTIANGWPNLYFTQRIAACVQLFKAGKIDYIIVSGDNSRSTYDEPTDMRNALINAGVDSTKIYLDYAGFRTFDSMVRLREIFGQQQVIVISQKFHNERAIYIGQKLGIETYGYNAPDVGKYFGFKTMLREKLARVKVIIDFYLGMKPRFLGERVEIK